MAASVTFLQKAGTGTNATAYTFSSQSLGTADADRYIIVGIVSRDTGQSTTLDSVTIGGVSATIVVNHRNLDGGGNTSFAAIAVANVPTGTTGDVVVTFSQETLRCGIGMWRTVGIDTTPTDTGGSSADDPTTSLDVSAGGIAVGIAMASNGTSTTTWAGLTEDWDDSTDVESTTYTGASDDFATIQSGLTVTANLTTPEAGNSAGAFASFAESTSGPANLKSYNTNLKANIKSINTNAIANVKSLNTNV